jgi:hypothetical protein
MNPPLPFSFFSADNREVTLSTGLPRAAPRGFASAGLAVMDVNDDDREPTPFGVCG